MKLFILLSFVVLELWTQTALSAAVLKNQSLFPLAIIHINDFHGKFEETNVDSTSCKEKLGQVCIGGIGRAITMVKKLKEERENQNKNPIFLNIGDNFVGTLWYELFGWNVTSHVLNLLPPDAMTLGNHEFDRGVQEVVNFLENMNAPVLVANFDDSEEPSLKGKYKKSIVIEKQGRKIGMIGALVVATVEISNPGKLKILAEIESVQKEAQRLRSDEGVDIILVLSHCGIAIDREMAQTSGNLIDVIVGGHSHSLLYRGSPVPGPDKPIDTYPIVYTQNNHKTLIVQASAYAKYLGDLTVYFDDKGEIQEYEGNTIFLETDIIPDPQIMEELKPWKEAVDEIGQREIGYVKTMLYKRDCNIAECNIGNFITDAFVDFIVSHPDFQDDSWTYASVAITNSGAIRTNLPPGLLIYDDLYTTLPFSNRLDVFELLGKDLLEALQFSGDDHGDYNFVHFSGLKVTYNVTLERERVTSVEILCRECDIPKFEPLDINKWYRVIVPSFIAGGGNGFTRFRRKRNSRITKEFDIEAAEQYFKKMSPVVQKLDGRITVLT